MIFWRVIRSNRADDGCCSPAGRGNKKEAYCSTQEGAKGKIWEKEGRAKRKDNIKIQDHNGSSSRNPNERS